MELTEFLGATTTAEPMPTAEAPVAVETPPQEAAPPAAQPRNERGQFAPIVEPAVEAPPAPEKEPHTVPISVLQAERRRRQEAEARAAALETPAPTVEVKDDEFWEAPVEATRKIVAGTTQQIQSQVQTIRYEIAEDAARSQFADYDQIREAFIAKHEAGEPIAIAIAQQMGSQANPARYMYEQTKRLETLAQVGDLAAFEARIRADEKARTLIEAGKRPPPPDVPRSLNEEPSAAPAGESQAFERTPLENLVTFNF